MEFIIGKITNIEPNGQVTIVAKYENIDRFVKRQYGDVQIGLSDGRRISVKQRNTIYAFLNAITEFQCEDDDARTKNLMKIAFNAKKGRTRSKLFSLSNCDMTTANEFTKFLIDFVIDWGIDLNFNIFQFLDKDKELVNQFVWSCLKHKKCTVCGRDAELHHVDRVGMGRNRDEIVHEGMEAMALCRLHHTEVHGMGDTKFYEKYLLLGGVPLDRGLCKVWKVKAKKEAA